MVEEDCGPLRRKMTTKEVISLVVVTATTRVFVVKLMALIPCYEIYLIIIERVES